MACSPEGECWCMALPPVMPMPDQPAGCLCPDCLAAAVQACLEMASSKM